MPRTDPSPEHPELAATTDPCPLLAQPPGQAPEPTTHQPGTAERGWGRALFLGSLWLPRAGEGAAASTQHREGRDVCLPPPLPRPSPVPGLPQHGSPSPARCLQAAGQREPHRRRKALPGQQLSREQRQETTPSKIPAEREGKCPPFMVVPTQKYIIMLAAGC